MQIIVYHSKARKTMCGMGTFCLIGMISLQLTIQNGDALIIAYPIDINMDTAPGLSQNMIYFYQNHFYIGYSMTVSGKLYGAQLRFGHWLTRPEYRYNQGALWTDWAAL